MGEMIKSRRDAEERKELFFFLVSHIISARIGKSQRVVEAVGITVVGLGVFRVLYHNIWREHPANNRVVHPAVHVNQAEVAVMLVHAEASGK